ncbi:FAD-dependent oxidoreductase [Egicoccus sp. AB-alg2]|uniref:FAD-dependent oxidoreductase n=1 Tax=Egicoccus sp. AB-alg2 TaxID=3242693 RepID=UPI00359D6D11
MARTDLLIIGGGTAGLAAAVTASELGIAATVVEKTDDLGGQLHWSFGQFSAAGTLLQRERGIEDTPDEHYADVMRIGHELATPHLVRLAVDRAGPMVDWLESLGFPFAPESPALVYGHEVYSRPRTYWGAGPRTEGGLAILRTLRPRVGDGIDVRLGHRVTDLLVEDGAVVGARVASADGEFEIRARATLLTTGGYAANRALLAEQQPRWPSALVGCRDHATGDGHEILRRRFGTRLIRGEEYIPTMGLIEDPDRPLFGFRLHDQRLIVDANSRLPWELWVNRRGERFVAEDVRSPHQREQRLLDQPDMAIAAIWDQHAVREGPPAIGPDWTRERELEEAERGAWLHRADSLAELAAKLDVDADGLAATVDAYNRAVAAGEPDPLGREHRPATISEPPFYGVFSRGGMLLTRGGPEVDEQLRPLDGDGHPVEGIRLAGEVLGMSQFSGDAFAGGMSIGPALSLGRWAVERFAEGDWD